jgi:GAF domain-containing protein
MSLKKTIKRMGVKNTLKAGIAMATSKSVTVAEMPKNEVKRVQRVEATGLVGQNCAEQFEIFNEVARLIVGSDHSVVNLLDSKSQFTISGAGAPYDSTAAIPRELTFCQHALLTPMPTIVEDARVDERFAGTFLVKEPFNAVFYGGFPIVLQDGVIIGTLCVGADRPIKMTTEQIRLMKNLAVVVGAQIVSFIEQANLSATRIISALGRFQESLPQAKLNDVTAFLNFSIGQTISDKERDDLIAKDLLELDSDQLKLTQAGRTLKNDLGLSMEAFKGTSLNTSAIGKGIDDLLSQLDID